MRVALTVAGSDPTGGAGCQADLQVFRYHGLHGAAVITALTIQDSAKVHQQLPVFPSLVLNQLRVLLGDLRPGAVKLGMLGSDDVVRNVMLGLDALPAETPVVIDPVLAASDGTLLLERRALGSLQALLEGRRLVTPNLPEAETLSGEDVSTRRGCERAARALVEQLGARAALVKGGHRDGDPDDLLATRDSDGTSLRWLPGERLDVGRVHGTGCALSAAITAGLALGRSLERAVDDARRFVADAMRASEAPGSGARLLVLPGEVA